MKRTGYRSQQTDQPIAPERPDNLSVALDGPQGADLGAHGEFDQKAKDRSAQLWLAQHSRRLARALTSRDRANK
jgi:hypothetical protein